MKETPWESMEQWTRRFVEEEKQRETVSDLCPPYLRGAVTLQEKLRACRDQRIREGSDVFPIPRLKSRAEILHLARVMRKSGE